MNSNLEDRDSTTVNKPSLCVVTLAFSLTQHGSRTSAGILKKILSVSLEICVNCQDNSCNAWYCRACSAPQRTIGIVVQESQEGIPQPPEYCLGETPSPRKEKSI